MTIRPNIVLTVRIYDPESTKFERQGLATEQQRENLFLWLEITIQEFLHSRKHQHPVLFHNDGMSTLTDL